MAITEGAICAISGASGALISVTSSTFNSTGGGALLFMVAHEGAPTTYTWTDNKSTPAPNFISLGTQNLTVGGSAGDMSLSAVYVHAPNVGTGHTVTATFGATRPFRYIGGVVLNGTFTDTFLAATTQQAENAGGATVDAGSLVTDAAAYLIQFSANYTGQSILAAGTDWSIKDNATGGRHFQARNEASAGTFDPSHTLTGGGSSFVTIAAAVKEGVIVPPPAAPTLHVIRSGIRLR